MLKREYTEEFLDELKLIAEHNGYAHRRWYCLLLLLYTCTYGLWLTVTVLSQEKTCTGCMHARSEAVMMTSLCTLQAH